MQSIDNIPHAHLPTKYGPAMIYGFLHNGKEHCAIVFGIVIQKKKVLCRIHSSCITGDVFHSLKCDCGEQLESALQELSIKGGILIYLDQEWRDIGLINKIKAYALQDKWYDTVDANTLLGLPVDNREYSSIPLILQALQVISIRLITNNPKKVEQLECLWIEVVERVHISIPTNPYNVGYIATKQQRMKHYSSKESKMSATLNPDEIA